MMSSQNSKRILGGFKKASTMSRKSNSTNNPFQIASSISRNDASLSESYSTNTFLQSSKRSRKVKPYKENVKKKKKNQITSFFSKKTTTTSTIFQMHTCIVGIGFGNRERLEEIPKDVKLVREPRNRVDRNALMAVTTRKHIGYIPKQDASLLSPALDRNAIQILSAHVPPQKKLELSEIIRLPLILKIKEMKSSIESLKSHAQKSRKRVERAAKKNKKRMQDRKFKQHSIMSLELKRRRKQKMPTATSILKLRTIPPAVWRLLFFCGGLNVRDFGRVKIAWRVWNNALSSEDYLKYYFVFSRYPLDRRLMPHDHSIDSKGGLMNIVIDVRKVFETQLQRSETRCVDVKRILCDLCDISDANSICENLIRNIESRQNQVSCSWIQLLTASMLLLCGTPKIHIVVRVELSFYITTRESLEQHSNIGTCCDDAT